MNRFERQAMIDDLESASAQTRADIAERRQQREMRGEYFDDPPQRFIRRTFETPTPTPTPTQQQEWSAWETWAQALIRKAIEAHDEILVDETALYISDQIAALRLELDALRAEIATLRAEKKDHLQS